MNNRVTSLRERLAVAALRRVLDRIQQEERRAPIFELIHRLLAGGPEVFKSALNRVLAREGWRSCQQLLGLLKDSSLGPWIGSDLLPRIAVLDLEHSPHSGAITEVAVLTSEGLLGTSPVMQALQAKYRSALPAAQISAFMRRHLKGADLLVGHNLNAFDLPILREYGVVVPGVPVLDTLSLSLLTNPLKARHALDGDHTAEGDVRANLALLEHLDRFWLDLDRPTLDWHRANSADDPGLHLYLQWAATRRVLGSPQPVSAGNISGLEETEHRSLLYGESVDVRSGRAIANELCSSCSVDKIEQRSAARLAELPGLSDWAREKAYVVAVPGRLIRHLRDRTARIMDTLTAAGALLATDRGVNREQAIVFLDTARPSPAKRFLQRWLVGGGRSSCELHAGAPIQRNDSVFDVVFNLANSWSGAERLMDHESWLRFGGNTPALVRDAEYLMEAISECDSDSISVAAPPPSVGQPAIDFVYDRSFSWEAAVDGVVSCAIGPRDCEAEDYRFLLGALSDLKGHSPREARRQLVPEKSLTPVLTVWVAKGVCDRIAVHRVATDGSSELSAIIANRPHARLVAGPLGDGRLRDALATAAGRPVTVSQESQSPSLTLDVAEDGSLGSIAGLPRMLMAAVRRICEDSQNPPSILGIGPDLQLALAHALGDSEVSAVAAVRFGSRQKTCDRIGEISGRVFLAGSAARPLPAGVTSVMLRRLPFPSRLDPVVAAMTESASDTADVFGDVILPRMLLRLREQLTDLTEQGLDALLLDKRALVHTFYRREIVKCVGPIRAVRPCEFNSETVTQIRKRLAKELDALGFRTTNKKQLRVDPDTILRRLYGPAANWRPHQEEITSRLLRGESLLAVLPTGSGKSACFQIPGIILGEHDDALTVVISPLIALMRDQVGGLRARGVQGVAAINSDLDPDMRAQVLRDVRSGWTILLYLAPEQLMNGLVRDALMERGVRLVVVDEAHCISEWGHDFRPEYQRIIEFIDAQERARAEPRAQVAAFTATATPSIQREICEALQIGAPTILAPVRRENLYPSIQWLDKEEEEARRMAMMVDFIAEQAPKSGLVYATTRKATESLANALREPLAPYYKSEEIDFLHAGVHNRADREREFLAADGRTKLLVSTTAFGMGVDKDDIEWIVHADAPGSVEAYTQEIGRAARSNTLTARLLALADESDLSLRAWMTRHLDEGDAREALRVLRQMGSAEGETLVNPGTIELQCGVDAELVGPALFALEKVGCLTILGRGAARMALEVSPDRQEKAADEAERRIVKFLETQGGRAELDLWKLATGPLDELMLLPEEVERIIRAMRTSGVLRAYRALEVCARISDAREQDETLRRLEDGEAATARVLERRRIKSGNRWMSVPLGELTTSLPGRGDLQTIDEILTEWRKLRWIDAERGLFMVRLRVRIDDLVEALDARAAQRRALLGNLQEQWGERDEAVPPRGSDLDSRTIQGLLGSLASCGILTWVDPTTVAQAYRVRIDPNVGEDEKRLETLSLRDRRLSGGYRQAALRDLLQQNRDSESIWNYLTNYFEREDPAPEAIKRACRTLAAGLTDQQRSAVFAQSTNPLLINAGAGTGKTHVLARRTLSLQLVDQLPASRMLVLSFSNAGAAAIGRLCATLAKELGLGAVQTLTFHSFCNRLLRLYEYDIKVVPNRKLPRALHGDSNYHNRLSYNAVLVDEFEDILRNLPSSSSRRDSPGQKIEDYARLMDSLRSGNPQLDYLILQAEDLRRPGLPESLLLPDDEGELPTAAVALALERYQASLKRRGQLDYAEMVVLAIRRLQDDHRTRRKLQNHLRHLLVDEFQDTSRSQESIMRLLVGPYTGLTVVGDSDQTIYTFNGSDVRNILDFAERNREVWPERQTAIVPLELNFRCTPNILKVASSFIKKNRNRLDKTLDPAPLSKGDHRESNFRRNAKVEASAVENGSMAVDVAIAMIRQWLAEGVSAREIAVVSRINPQGNKTKALLDNLEAMLRYEGIPVAEERRQQQTSVKRIINEVRGRAKNEPDRPLQTWLAELQQASEEGERGKDATLLAGALRDAIDRGLTTTQEWAEQLAEPPQKAAAETVSGGQGGVTMKTIHGAKGEEYRRVIVLHLGSGHFPPRHNADLEEERRLLYVALTRAEELVHVTGERGNTFFDELLEVGGENIEYRVADPEMPPEGTPRRDNARQPSLSIRNKVENDETKGHEALEGFSEKKLDDTKFGTIFKDFMDHKE